ncbi:hypothetical protein Bca4012_050592 [Brassica carinata]
MESQVPRPALPPRTGDKSIRPRWRSINGGFPSSNTEEPGQKRKHPHTAEHNNTRAAKTETS